MLQIRPSSERGAFDFGWLQTRHSFSFGEYHDPQHMGYRALRVINEDHVQPGQGFGLHPHRDMEIVTLVLAGELEHRDSLGHGEILRRGELQRMTAGTGISHSEFNPSATAPVHLYQIWLRPRQRGLPPGYEQKPFNESQRLGRWQLVASPDGRDGSLHIQQDACLWLARISPNQPLPLEIAAGRGGWLQVLEGEVRLGMHELRGGDGVAIENEPALPLTTQSVADVMLFDLA